MNTDEHGFLLSVFIRVHLWLFARVPSSPARFFTSRRFFLKKGLTLKNRIGILAHYLREFPMPDDTWNKILDAAEHLLARLGYQKMTVDDIAAEAGISKRTIYLHFPSKEEVVLVTIDRIVARLKERMRAIADEDGPPAVRLRAMLRQRVMFRFDSVREYRQGIDESVRTLRPGLLARRARHFAEEAELIAETLAEGRAAGQFACDDDLATAHAMILATNALLPASLSTGELDARAETEARALRIIDLLVGGVLMKDGVMLARGPAKPARRRAALPR
jgi:AcrR family transcriptional regulator